LGRNFRKVSRGLSNAQASAESVLGGAKRRGIRENGLLNGYLRIAPAAFAIRNTIPLRERAKSPSTLRYFCATKKLLAIDSKFPLDAFAPAFRLMAKRRSRRCHRRERTRDALRKKYNSAGGKTRWTWR